MDYSAYALTMFALFSAGLLAAVFRRKAQAPKPEPESSPWAGVFAEPIPPYMFPPLTWSEPELSEDAMNTGTAAIEITLARVEEQVKGLQRDQRNQAEALREGLQAISKNLSESARDQNSLLSKALDAFKNDYVPKTEYNTLAFQVKVLWAVDAALGGIVLTMVAKAIFKGVTL